MDEPCSALDPIATTKIEELIYELKRDFTIVIVTHNMQQAARVSEFTAFFMLGRLVEHDRPRRSSPTPARRSPRTTSRGGSARPTDRRQKETMKAVVTKGKDGARGARRERTPGAMKRIALIEDDADIAYTIRLNLRKEKRYQVEHYVSGIAALAAVQEKPFDLVILDLNLPDIDGLALCRELRRADETRKVPIIMLTARVEERDKLLGFEIGADDYITKPFSMRELLARVNAHLRRVAAFETSEEEIFHDGDLVRRPGALRGHARAASGST